MGCLDIGRGIKIPVFAKYCSRLCYYDGDEAKQSEIIYCPHNGTKSDELDRIMQQEMLRKNPSPTTTTERIIKNPDMTLGLSTLVNPGKESGRNSRERVVAPRPLSFGRFDRPESRNKGSDVKLFSPSRTSPSTQQTKLDKTVHERFQEGFFDSHNDLATKKKVTSPTFLRIEDDTGIYASSDATLGHESESPETSERLSIKSKSVFIKTNVHNISEHFAKNRFTIQPHKNTEFRSHAEAEIRTGKQIPASGPVGEFDNSDWSLKTTPIISVN